MRGAVNTVSGACGAVYTASSVSGACVPSSVASVLDCQSGILSALLSVQSHCFALFLPWHRSYVSVLVCVPAHKYSAVSSDIVVKCCTQ